jgi:hypothetical protein
MTELADNNRQQGYRDEAQAADYQDEMQDRDIRDGDIRDGDLRDGAIDAGYGGQRQSDPVAYPDGAGDAGYQDDRAGYRDQADPDVLGTDETVLTRDPEAGVIAQTGTGRTDTGVTNTGVMAREPGPDTDPGRDQTVVNEPDALLTQWQEVQTGFVDDPQKALRAADELVQQVMRQIEEQFAAERAGMERPWSRGEDVSTEDLRLVLQRYRTFFNRLLRV